MSESVAHPWIAGFWARIGALLIDCLLLGVLGFTLGLFLEDTFVQMGAWGRLIGFCISLVYFGVMNSGLGGGQTLGKRLLNLRVVALNGEALSFGRSMVRYVILALPFYLNNLPVVPESYSSVLLYPLSFVVMGGILSIVYLYVFNRRTRQSLHDWIVGSYVVRTTSVQQEMTPLWQVHKVVVGLVFVLAAVGPLFGQSLMQIPKVANLLQVYKALSELPNVRQVSIKHSTHYSASLSGTSTTTTYVAAELMLYNDQIDDVEFAQQVLRTIKREMPTAKEQDFIAVAMRTGYDIGIWSSWRNHVHRFNRDEADDVTPELNGD